MKRKLFQTLIYQILITKKKWFKYINNIYIYICAYLCFWSTFECNRKKSNRLLQIRIALQPSYKCERAYRVSIQELSQISCKLMQLIVGNVTWRSCSATSRTSYRPLYNLFDIGRVWRHGSRIKTNCRIFDVFRCFNWSPLRTLVQLQSQFLNNRVS